MDNNKKRKPTSIRIPYNLEKIITDSAKKNERSISREIIFILQEHYKKKE